MESNSGQAQPKYSFALKRIQLLEKNLTVFPRQAPEPIYDFDISLKISLDQQKELSIHFFSVSVKLKPENKVLASIAIVCVFDIHNYNEVVIEDSDEPVLPQGLLNLLNTVVIGTMRGIMFSEFRGTALDNVIFPVLDPTRFERG